MAKSSPTITVSLSMQDAYDLEKGELQNVSPTAIFRSALGLYRSMGEFMDIYDILDYRRALRSQQDKIMMFQKEIERRQEIIDSLRDVLAQKELNERRVRAPSGQVDGLRGEANAVNH